MRPSAWFEQDNVIVVEFQLVPRSISSAFRWLPGQGLGFRVPRVFLSQARCISAAPGVWWAVETVSLQRGIAMGRVGQSFEKNGSTFSSQPDQLAQWSVPFHASGHREPARGIPYPSVSFPCQNKLGLRLFQVLIYKIWKNYDNIF